MAIKIEVNFLRKILIFLFPWLSLLFLSCNGVGESKITVDGLNDKLGKVFNPGSTGPEDSGSGSSSGDNSSTLLLLAPKQQVWTGVDSLISNHPDGTGLTGNAFGFGVIDTFYPSYKAPKSAAPRDHSISLSSSNGYVGIPLEVRGMGSGIYVPLPESFGDQNYPMGVAKTADGAIYTSSIIIDTPGWEWWAIFKSTDNGGSWTMVDKFIPADYPSGETHSLEMLAKGNDLYICGYGWSFGDNPYNSEWFVRKTSDGGATWTNVDRFGRFEGRDNVCQAIAVAPNGNIYTAGYYDDASNIEHLLVRESTDDGATWTDIYDTTSFGYNEELEISPNGDIWLTGGGFSNTYVLKGTFDGTNWNFTNPYNFSFSGRSYTYQHWMDLLVIDNTTAFHNTGNGTTWQVYKTTDGGSTWSLVYSRSGYRGDSLYQLANGDLLASASVSNTRSSIVKSTDGGTTWTEVFNGGSDDASWLIQANNGNVLLIKSERPSYNMATYISSDNGDNWTGNNYILYTEELWSEVYDVAKDAAGNFYATGWKDARVDPSYVPPATFSYDLAVMRSTDGGSTWTNVTTLIGTGNSYTGNQIETDASGNIYIAYTTYYSYGIYASPDNGSTWSVLDEQSLGTWASRTGLAIDDNYVYYFGKNWNGSTLSSLRRMNKDGSGIVDVATWPLDASYSNPNPIYLKKLNNGNIVAYVDEDLGATQYFNLYESSDSGVTWTTIYSSTTSFNFQEAPDGRYFIKEGQDFYISRDGGATWDLESKYSNNTYSYVVTNDNNILFYKGNEVFVYSNVLKKLVSAWDWYDTGDLAVDDNWDDYDFYDCPFSPLGVCYQFILPNYTVGSQNTFYPLQTGDGLAPEIQPSDFRQVANTTSSIDLSWRSSHPDVAGYKVVYVEGTNTPPSCDDSTAINLGNNTSATMSGLSPSTLYTVRICSYNSSGVSTVGSVDIFYTQATTPEISDLLIQPDLTTLDLSWTAAGGITTGYSIAYAPEGKLPLDCDQGTIIDAGNVTSYQITGLTSDTSYGVRVCSYDASGNKSHGVTATISTTKVGWNLEAHINHANNTSRDDFGYNVRLEDDLLITSAPMEDSNSTTIINGTTTSTDDSASAAGAVYVYRRSGKLWQQDAYIKPSNTGASDQFGYGIDVFNDTIVVGSPSEDSNQTTISNGVSANTDNSLSNSGAAYVYRYSGGVWSEEAYLKAPNAGGSDYFGRDVKIHNNLIAVSSPYEDSNQSTITNEAGITDNNLATTAGSVYIYSRSGSTWSLEAYIKPPNPGSSDSFGVSMDLTDEYLVVGSPGEDSNQTVITNGPTASPDNTVSSSGAAYVFKRDATGTWTQEAYLKSPAQNSGDLFGQKVEFEGDVIVVGAPFDSSDLLGVQTGTPTVNELRYRSGAMHVFRKTSGLWNFEAYLKSNITDSQCYAGATLSITGNTILGVCRRGYYLHFYEFAGGSWSLDNTIEAKYYINNPATNYNHQRDVLSFSGSTFTTGNIYDYYNSGKVTVYSFPSEYIGTSSSQRTGAVNVYRNFGTLFEPKGLSYTDLQTTSIDLRWEMNLGEAATGIKIAYAQGTTAPIDCDSGTSLDLGMTNSTSITGLISGTDYSFRICSYSASEQTQGYTRTYTTR